MSYEPTNWKSGDTVTSAKLNKMEQGIAAAGPLIANMDTGTGALDKTWQEIYDADYALVQVISGESYKQIYLVTTAAFEDSVYNVIALSEEGALPFSASSADDYPVVLI